MKVHITITGIVISMDVDAADVHDAIEQVKSICHDDPSEFIAAIEDAVGLDDSVTMSARY